MAVSDWRVCLLYRRSSLIRQKALLEETGVSTGLTHYLKSFYADPGFPNQKIHVCAIKDVVDVGEQRLENLEFWLVCKKVPISSISALVDTGDGWGMAGH